MSMKKSIHAFVRTPFVKHVATLQAGRFFSVGCGFLSSIIYARYLGISGFGQYAVVLAFVGTMGMFTNLGQQAALTTFLAESYGRKDYKKMHSVCRYYASCSLIAAMLLIIFAVLSPFFTSWIYSDEIIGKLAILVFASSLLEFPFSYVSIVLQVTRKIRILTIIENAKIVLQLGLSVLFLILGYGVAGILFGSLLGAFAFLCIALIIYPKIQREHKLPTWREMSQIRNDKEIWKYWKDGFWIALDKNIGNLYPTVFLFILSISTSEAIVGLVRLAFKLASLPTAFSLSSISRLSSSVLPEVAGRGTEVLKKSVKKLVIYSIEIHSLLTLGAISCVPIV